MASSIGAKIELQGEAQFKKAVTEINTNLRTLGTEMTKVKSEFDKNDKSIEFYTKKNQVLNKQIDEQKNKIEALEKGLKVSAEKYGENATQTQKWQQDLNRATADLNKMEREVSDNTKAMDELGKETEDTGKSVDGTGGKFEKFGGVLKGVAVAAGAAAVAAGAAAVKLAKDVVAGYAEYEQLVGGVDTLFGESSLQLQEYANNAYKTAGLSANAYMETVTGFSASLIQSLGGDTEEAVKYADMVMTDMSDNANKMGTNIESVQNAYSGFAKGNFTMLDNLKLGYGGTKAEMERLLEEAEKISGFKYDVSSYADIVDAIHVVQTEMGITGTTALEASDTISGSVNAMSSAWENWLVGLGNSNADMTGLTQNLVEGFQNVLENLMPVIGNIAEALPGAFNAILPAISDIFPDLLVVVAGLFNQVLESLLKMLPELIPVAVDAVLMIANTLIDNLPLIIDSAIILMMALTDGLIDALPILIPATIEMIIALAGGLIDALPELIRRLPEIINAIVTGLVEGIPKILEFIPTLYTNLVTAVTETDWAQMGKDIVEGLWNGINSLADWIREKVTGFVNGIGDTIKNFFGIESPSTLMAEYGRYIDEGLAKGIDDNASKPISSADTMATTIGSAMQKISGFVESTVSVIQKEFKLWKLQNEDLEGSSQELELQLEAQKKEHELLTEQIQIAEQALKDIITQYGESSTEALKYKNELLDLQIQQAGLTKEVDKTTEALSGMAKIQERIAAYDKKNYGSSGSGGGGTSNKKKNDDAILEVAGDEVSEIAKRNDVDIGVAIEMWRQNEADKLAGKIPRYFNGTNNYPGGWGWMNELGPELVKLPKGSQIIPHKESKEMLSGGDTFHVTIDARNIKDFTDVVRVFTGIRQTARQGV